MIVAVLDTNVLVSGVLGFRRESSVPGELLWSWLRNEFAVALSDHVMFGNGTLLGIALGGTNANAHDASVVMSQLEKRTRYDPTPHLIPGIATHPEDDLVIATALAADADALVTGDGGLLRVGAFAGISIMSPQAFLAVLQP